MRVEDFRLLHRILIKLHLLTRTEDSGDRQTHGRKGQPKAIAIFYSAAQKNDQRGRKS